MQEAEYDLQAEVTDTELYGTDGHVNVNMLAVAHLRPKNVLKFVNKLLPNIKGSQLRTKKYETEYVTLRSNSRMLNPRIQFLRSRYRESLH